MWQCNEQASASLFSEASTYFFPEASTYFFPNASSSFFDVARISCFPEASSSLFPEVGTSFFLEATTSNCPQPNNYFSLLRQVIFLFTGYHVCVIKWQEFVFRRQASRQVHLFKWQKYISFQRQIYLYFLA